MGMYCSCLCTVPGCTIPGCTIHGCTVSVHNVPVCPVPEYIVQCVHCSWACAVPRTARIPERREKNGGNIHKFLRLT